MEWEVLNGALNIIERVNSWIIILHDFDKRKELDKFIQKLGYTTNGYIQNIDQDSIFIYMQIESKRTR